MKCCKGRAACGLRLLPTTQQHRSSRSVADQSKPLCRPFESGEVTVQPYNTLLSMSSLVELSSGILLLQNEVLAATCSRLLGIKHPTFKVSAAGWRLEASGKGIHSMLITHQSTGFGWGAHRRRRLSRECSVRACAHRRHALLIGVSCDGVRCTTHTCSGSSSDAPAAAATAAAATQQDLNAVAARGLASALLPCHQRPVQAAPSISSSPNKQPSPRTATVSPLPSSSMPLSPVADLTCHLFSHPRCTRKLLPAAFLQQPRLPTVSTPLVPSMLLTHKCCEWRSQAKHAQRHLLLLHSLA